MKSGWARRRTSTVVLVGKAPKYSILTFDVPIALGKGLATQQLYAALGTDQVHRARLLSASDSVEFSFPFFRVNLPFFPLGAGKNAVVSTALVSLKLSFDTSTGAILGASGIIGTPKFE